MCLKSVQLSCQAVRQMVYRAFTGRFMVIVSNPRLLGILYVLIYCKGFEILNFHWVEKIAKVISCGCDC